MGKILREQYSFHIKQITQKITSIKMGFVKKCWGKINNNKKNT